MSEQTRTTAQFSTSDSSRDTEPASTTYYNHETPRDTFNYANSAPPTPLPKENTATEITKERVSTPYSMLYSRIPSQKPNAYDETTPTPIPAEQKDRDDNTDRPSKNKERTNIVQPGIPNEHSVTPEPTPMIFTNAGNVRTAKPNKQTAKPNEQPSTPKSAPSTFKNAELLHKQPVQYADLYTNMRSDSKTPTASNSVNINTNVTPTALTNCSATNSTSQAQANQLNIGPDISSARRTTVEEEYARSTSTLPTTRAYPSLPVSPAPMSAPLEYASQESMDMRLEKLKRKIRFMKRGAIEIFPISRNNNGLEFSILVDGFSPDTAFGLRGLKDAFAHNHPAFKLITAEKIVQGVSSEHPDYYDWTHIDPEFNDLYQGIVPGTVTLKTICHIVTAKLNSHLYRVNPATGEHELPYVTLREITDTFDRRKYHGISSSDVDNWTELEKIVGTWATTEATRDDMFSVDKQCEIILMLLNNPTYCYSFLSNRSVNGLMANKFENTLTVIYQNLLALELMLRLPHVSPQVALDINAVVKADIIISKRWMDNLTVLWHVNNINYKFQPRIAEQQIEGMLKFADEMRWPYRDMVETGLTDALRKIQAGTAVGTHIWDWLFGLCLPGKYYSVKALTVLLLLSPPDLAKLGIAPYYHGGLMLMDRTYWRTTSVIGRVLGGSKDVKSCLHWIGPCIPVVEGVEYIPQWLNLTSREIDLEEFIDPHTELDTLLPYDMSDSSHPDFERQLRRMELSDNWINPHPPPPKRPEDGGDVIDIQGIKLEKNNLADEVAGGVKYSLTYYAALLIRVNQTVLTFNLTYSPYFICSHPCVGVHERHRAQLHRKYTIVEAPDLRNSPRFDHTLIVNVQGSNEAEVMARAWCAQQGRHAVIRIPQTCFCCAWEFARSINVKVIIYQ
jgi:hypothetical protein